MALRHFLRLEREVRVGGFGPPRFRLGGRWYTVGPISVLRWTNLSTMLSTLTGGQPVGPEFGETFRAMPPRVASTLLPLMLSDKPRRKDLLRAKPDQLSAVWEAFCQVNDLVYIQTAFSGEGKQGEPTGLGLEDLAMILTEKTSGARLPDELLQLPMQHFLALFDCLKHLRNVRDGRPADCDPPDEGEVREFSEAFTQAGFEVN